MTATAPAPTAARVCLCCGNPHQDCSPVKDIGWICRPCEQGNRRAENDIDEILRRWQ